ncbi:MAG: sensor histidine kinase, partial [Alphaproteobacteria bacterium]|nr:sensor histidine kinase [Alphaproteobacteria bacterium]
MIRRLSLHARLLLLGALTGVAALLFAAFGIGEVLQGFVLRDVDERLDTQIAILADAVTPQARLDRARVVELPPFAAGSQGWGWRVRSAAGSWSGGAEVAVEPGRRGHRHGAGEISSGRGRMAHGFPLYVRQTELATPRGAVEIIAAAPRSIIDRPLREAMGPLLLSLGLLGLGL